MWLGPLFLSREVLLNGMPKIGGRAALCTSPPEKHVCVVLLGWLYSKEKQLKRYSELYADQGVATKIFLPQLSDVLFPDSALERLQKLQKQLREESYSGVIMHSFSVGAYLTGQYALLPPSVPIVGAVVDSPVDYDGVPRGLATATTDSPRLQALSSQAAFFSLRLLEPFVTKKHRAASAAFHDLSVPSLWVYSPADRICDVDNLERVASKWAARQPLAKLKLDDSPHVSHLRTHPDKYSSSLASFLQPFH